MPLILHIETSTEVCSVGLSRQGRLLALRETDERYRHASRITLFVESCLKEARVQAADIDAVAVSRGPGSFTALRIGTSAAKGICYALDKPLLSIDTLQALAYGAWKDLKLVAAYYPMIDARRMEVYTAGYDAGQRPIAPARAVVMDREAFAEERRAGTGIVLTGNGAEKCRPLFDDPALIIHPLACSARHMVQLAERAYLDGERENLAYFEPFYLKPPNVTKSKKLL